jgi:hypothetical protein
MDNGLQMRENGLDAFVVLERRRWTLNAEYVRSFQKDRDGEFSNYSMQGGIAELAFHFMNRKFHPFVRYDQTSLPDGGGPYLSLRQDGEALSRAYIPIFKGVMSGAAYDVDSHFRLKGELIRHLDGPRQQWGVAFQAAFGF